VCCSNNGCPSALAPECKLVSYSVGGVPAHNAFVCGAAAGSGAFLSDCTTGDVCRSNACLLDDSPSKYCSKACCNSDSCGEFNGLAVSCKYVGSSTTGFVRACAALALDTGALKSVGTPCSTDDECRSARCLSENGAPGYCSDSCCSDFDCGDQAFGLRCLPVNSSGDYVLRCKKVN
jgi:hypothetical protein